MTQIYGIEKAKVDNGICPDCGNKLLHSSWDYAILLPSTLDLFCETCKLRFRITEGVFSGRQTYRYKIN